MYENLGIVYVEDDPMSRQIMEFLLVHDLKLPHVTILEDSTDFIARVKALAPRPTLFILDIHMMPHTGFEMLDMLRNDPMFEDAIVVALTASVMDNEVQKLRQSGFDSCISKPIDASMFPDLLSRIVNGEKLWYIR